ncbi:NAD-P-binding protein [Pseudohyphozyma bogoriensis]|nr:NAD-P-binding protein [Pseudohyphozyma bogoriensis]
MFSSAKFDPARDIPDLSGEVALVSGANSGIGFQTAQQLALHGAKVYVGSRKAANAVAAIQRMEANHPTLKGKDLLHVFELDLSTVKGVKADAEKLLDIETRLDILVNNAGVAERIYEINSEGVEAQFAVDHLGPFTITQTLLPLLIKTAAQANSDVRVVTVASGAHQFVNFETPFASLDDFNIVGVETLEKGHKFIGRFRRYGMSKLASILFARQLQHRLLADPTPGANQIISISLHPGEVATEGFFRTFWYFKPFWRLFFLSPLEGSFNSLFAATAPEVRREEKKWTGKYLVPHAKIKAPTERAQDDELAATLWATSERVVEDILAKRG